MRRHNPVAEWIDAHRAGSTGAYALRGVILVLGVVVDLACATVFGTANDLVGWVFSGVLLMAAVAAAVRPDGFGPGLMVGSAALWCWFRGQETPWWAIAPVALLLVALHCLTAWGAAGPLHTGVERGTWRQLARRLGLLLLASVVGIAVVVGAWASPVPDQFGWTAFGICLVLVAIVALVAMRGEDGR